MYEIGDKKYIQRKLVPGQVEQLLDLLSDVNFDGGFDVRSIIATVGNKLWKAIAIVIREEGSMRWWDKDLDALAQEIQWSLPIDEVVGVVKDFFDCNPVISLLEQINGMNANLKKQTLEMRQQIGQQTSSSSSAEGI
jgi:hypothetical protein